jgi:hypothetical protein
LPLKQDNNIYVSFHLKDKIFSVISFIIMFTICDRLKQRYGNSQQNWELFSKVDEKRNIHEKRVGFI